MTAAVFNSLACFVFTARCYA